MAHPDLNELLNALLPMAQMLLTKPGEFLPIGAIMLADGEIRHVGAKIDGDDYPGSQPLIDLLIENFQKEAAKGRLRAAAVCYDVLTVPPGKDQKQWKRRHHAKPGPRHCPSRRVWKRGMVRLLRHRQTKGPVSAKPHLNRRATPRLHRF